jgi:hypothetical protein
VYLNEDFDLRLLVLISCSISSIVIPILQISELTSAEGTDNTPSSGITLKFRIYGLENKSNQVVIFLSGHDFANAKFLNAGHAPLIYSGAAYKQLTGELTIPSYFMKEGSKFKVCVIEVQSTKLLCSTREYEKHSIPEHIAIFMNLSRAIVPVPDDIWRSIN